VNDGTFERIEGIREDLPAGEHVLWQGAPDWRSLARHAFHLSEVAIYFALLSAASALAAWADGRPLGNALLPAGLGAAACMMLALLAWMSSRTTIYAITTGRVFMRIGIALPLSINLPLRRIEAARLALRAGGCGDIPLFLEPAAHLAYLHLWPHARPWCVKRPEPMLRSIADAAHVAGILSGALQAVQPDATAAAPAAPAPGTRTMPAPSVRIVPSRGLEAA
jgi:hypothetical protein